MMIEAIDAGIRQASIIPYVLIPIEKNSFVIS